MSKLLEITYGDSSTFDVTPHIVLNSYNVSSQPDYETWTDGNQHERRGVKRRKLKGSFSLMFFDRTAYANFLNAIENGRETEFDYYTVNIYDNKARNYRSTVNVYLDFELPNVEPSIGYSFNEEIEVEVTER